VATPPALAAGEDREIAAEHRLAGRGNAGGSNDEIGVGGAGDQHRRFGAIAHGPSRFRNCG
jgi:hypothetical protein